MIRNRRGERAAGSAEATDEAVAREHRSALAIGHRAAQHRMLERNEHADAAGRGIDRAGERDHEEKGKIVDQSESNTGRDHETCRGEQEPPIIMTRADQPDTKGQQRGTEERHGRDHTDLDDRKAERRQVHRQQDGDEPVTEVTQCPGRQQVD